VYQYLPFLAAHGIATRVVPFWPRSEAGPPASSPAGRTAARARTLARVLVLSALAPRYDVTLVQRVLLPSTLQRLIAHRTRRLVFDVDDAIYTTHPGMADAERWAARARPRFTRMLELSDAAFVSTPVLAAEAHRHQSRVFELPSPVDCERYQPRHIAERRHVVVGWIGSPSTTMYLRPLLPVCRRLAARHRGLRFEAVGADPRIDLEPFEVRPWSLATELDDLGGFDIGVMPLTDDEWARGKAGYKLLQYLACGIASVASPVGASADLLRGGETGLPATGADEWERALTTLIEDPGFRRRLGHAGRALVEQEYSLARWAPRFEAALASVTAGPYRARVSRASPRRGERR
jgi:glycosyltransferase involved in cell wall biosynthesis